MVVDRTRIPYLPERIEGLAIVATNIAWSWNRDARRLFQLIDDPLWHLTRHNPIAIFRRIDPQRLNDCARDPAFLELYDRVMTELDLLRTTHGTWMAREYPDIDQTRPVAYFCAEFGLHNSVPIYSGGLGVLAGDHCKSASDLGVPLTGIGLFYTKGYFDQQLRLDGWQEDSDEQFDVMNTPLERVYGAGREAHLTSVLTSGREIFIGAWRMLVGRVPVYLLDTDLEQNHPDDRELTSKLYAGGPEVRLRTGVDPGCGRRARVAGNGRRSCGLACQRRPCGLHDGGACAGTGGGGRHLRGSHAGCAGALDLHDAHAGSSGPRHVLGGAGGTMHGPVWETLGVDRETFFAIGRHPEQAQDQFHMTVAAIRMSKFVNGVSRRHGEVSRQLWAPLWPGRSVEEVPIGCITNGVHLATWMTRDMMGLLDAQFGADWGRQVDEPQFWDRMLELDDERLWQLRTALKSALLNFVREEARRRWARHWKEATHVVGAGTLLNPKAFTIGFARRFATYKRADLIFRDIERLRVLLVNPARPVQIIFAGKAHPADTPGKEVLRTVYGFTRDPRLEGRVAFLEDYELHLAHRLVQGVDLWLNLPRVPFEASGTSGMKAGLNGVPQVSTLDGWWHEGYEGLNGWAIPPASSRSTPDEWDADQLYRLLEEQVVPLYYTRDERDVPVGWVEKMKHAIRVAGQQFTARRMLREYVTRCYGPAMRGNNIPDDPPGG